MIGSDEKLYICTSDERGGVNAQDLNNLSGKILRYNLDGSIPDDNPDPTSPIYTSGHRNPQGLTETDNGVIISSEHGTAMDDEINLIVSGANYGWPLIEGKCDDPQETEACDQIQNFKEPLFSWTPTIAPSNIQYYRADRYGFLTNKLLQITLKEADIRVIEIDNENLKIKEQEVLIDNYFGRLRDITFTDDGRIFLSTANNLPRLPWVVPERKESLEYDVIVEIFPSEVR